MQLNRPSKFERPNRRGWAGPATQTVIASAFVLLFAGCRQSTAPERIVGGGATSIEPLIQSWQPSYEAVSGVQVDYIGAGSGNGVRQMIRRSIQFGCTDAPLNAEQLAEAQAIGGNVLHIPLAISGVVPICRVPQIADQTPVRFSGPILAAIFLGKVVRWNDPGLQSMNPHCTLPDAPIKVVSRSEPSGTTAVFAEFLARSDPGLWNAHNMGHGPSVTFAIGIRQKGNPGVAGEVFRNEGSIGYVDLTYATQINRPLSFGAVRNSAGQFVVATPESIGAAAHAVLEFPDDLRFSIIDARGAGSYPICGANWAVFYRRQPTQSGRQLVEFLRWAIRKDFGQSYSTTLGYAPLPDSLARRARGLLESVELD